MLKYFRLRAVLILVIVFCAVLYGWHWYALRQFENAYLAYARSAAAHDEAATIPILPENPLRRDLNAALADVLTGNLTPAGRLERARAGEALLVLAEGNLDAVGEVGKDVREEIFTMEARAKNPAMLMARAEARTIIELAYRRADIVADIRALSYRANHQTKEIFDRIVSDDGVLTSEHAADLERLLPEVEEGFNRRSNLYAELGVMERSIAEAFAEFESSW